MEKEYNLKIPEIILSGMEIPCDYSKETKQFTKDLCRLVKENFEMPKFTPKN